MKFATKFFAIFLVGSLFPFSVISVTAAKGQRVIQRAITNTNPINLAPSARLHYLVNASRHGLTLRGEANMDWKVTGLKPNQRYSIFTETRAEIFGKIGEASSVGRIDASGLAPDKYEETRRNKPAVQARFDRQVKKIIFSDSGETYALKGGEQDRTSAIWQLVSIARTSPKKFVPKSQWNFVVAGRRDAKIWTFSVEKNISLVTPFGQLSTVWVSKVSPDQRIDVWLAPSLEWYPVKVKFRDTDGDTIEQNLVEK
ncbi:MAG: hypothetical protein K0R08_2195 [Solimicrobium sp.]|nr:hypothetical protein [Solimicrobium sp.]